MDIERKFTKQELLRKVALANNDFIATVDVAADTMTLIDGRILFAEDNDINAELAALFLKNLGAAAVDRANDGKEGVEMFLRAGENYYDCILMDLRMPVMDGLTAAREIRKLSRPDAQTVPIVAMTADAYTDDAEKCRAAGMNDHLAKPIDRDKVIACLSKYL